MDRTRLIDQLARHRDLFRAMLTELTPDEFRWKPAPEKWCALEVVCHLYDEERDDFRARLHHVLTDPETSLPPTDRVGWVTQRRYVEQDFNEALLKFLAERERAVEWLRSLKNAPWHNAHIHPKVGAIPAELFLVNWVAHDLHHFRQLNNLRYGHLASISPFSLEYAGTW